MPKSGSWLPSSPQACSLLPLAPRRPLHCRAPLPRASTLRSPPTPRLSHTTLARATQPPAPTTISRCAGQIYNADAYLALTPASSLRPTSAPPFPPYGPPRPSPTSHVSTPAHHAASQPPRRPAGQLASQLASHQPGRARPGPASHQPATSQPPSHWQQTNQRASQRPHMLAHNPTCIPCCPPSAAPRRGRHRHRLYQRTARHAPHKLERPTFPRQPTVQPATQSTGRPAGRQSSQPPTQPASKQAPARPASQSASQQTSKPLTASQPASQHSHLLARTPTCSTLAAHPVRARPTPRRDRRVPRFPHQPTVQPACLHARRTASQPACSTHTLAGLYRDACGLPGNHHRHSGPNDPGSRQRPRQPPPPQPAMPPPPRPRGGSGGRALNESRSASCACRRHRNAANSRMASTAGSKSNDLTSTSPPRSPACRLFEPCSPEPTTPPAVWLLPLAPSLPQASTPTF